MTVCYDLSMAETKKNPAKKSATTTKAKAAKKPQDRKISIEASREAIDVNLVGEEYVIHPPKTIVMLEFTNLLQGVENDPSKIMDIVNKYIDASFTKTDAKAVKKRLQDESDSLDLQHIMNLIEQVTEMSTGNLST